MKHLCLQRAVNVLPILAHRDQLVARLLGHQRLFHTSLWHYRTNTISIMSDKDTQQAASSNFAIKSKVQLHVHLDGAIRLKSVLPLAEKRGICLPCKNYDDLHKAVVMKEPETLTTFLERFQHWAPTFTGCLESIRSLAWEFAEDMYEDNVIYTEARFCPHLMTGGKLSPDEVVEAIIDEFQKAEKQYNIKLRIILCCIRSMPEISKDMVRLCEKYKGPVVAIDIAGDENLVENGCPTQQEHIEAFQLAKDKNIHRTVHAGENGSASVVSEAVDLMFAERVGHGYRTIGHNELYQRLLKEGLHFECCPYSSIITGACEPHWSKHAIIRFAEDDFNFGLNTDDPTITDTTLSKEYEIVEKETGIPRLKLLKTVFNAAKSSFLPDDEKQELLARLHAEYDAIVPEAKDF